MNDQHPRSCPVCGERDQKQLPFISRITIKCQRCGEASSLHEAQHVAALQDRYPGWCRLSLHRTDLPRFTRHERDEAAWAYGKFLRLQNDARFFEHLYLTQDEVIARVDEKDRERFQRGWELYQAGAHDFWCQEELSGNGR